MKATKKTFNLIKTRDGERKGVKTHFFCGDSANDPKMLAEIKSYLNLWIESYTSISDEEKEELFADFDGTLHYDVWTYTLEEEGVQKE